MKRCMRCAVWLYPAAWRKRYAGEFEALLEDAELCWGDLWDIVRGALTMQMKRWTFAKVAGVCAVVGLAIAAIVAVKTPSMYRSQSVMKIGTQMPVEDVAQHLDRAEQTILSRSSLAKVIMDGKLYENERTAEPLEDIVQEMRNKSIQIRLAKLANQANVFSIAFDYPDPAKAQFVTRTLSSQFKDQPGAAIEVLDPATLPDQPVSPRRSRIVIIGMIVGLLAGTLIFGAGRWPRVALTGLAAGVITLVGAYFLPDSFISTAVLRLPDDQSAQAVRQSVTGLAFLQSLIDNLKLYPGEPAEKAVAEMRNHDLIIRGIANHALLIQFRYTDESHEFAVFREHLARYKAQQVLQRVVAQAVAAPANAKIEVLDPPSLPEQPFQPNRIILTLFGLVAGVLLGAAWGGLSARRRLKPARS